MHFLKKKQKTELNEVVPKVQHIWAARGQGLIINSNMRQSVLAVASLRCNRTFKGGWISFLLDSRRVFATTPSANSAGSNTHLKSRSLIQFSRDFASFWFIIWILYKNSTSLEVYLYYTCKIICNLSPEGKVVGLRSAVAEEDNCVITHRAFKGRD